MSYKNSFRFIFRVAHPSFALINSIIFAITLFFALPIIALAQAIVTDPWIRSTVNGQKVTGAFMSLYTDEDLVLIKISSPIADRIEIHRMVNQNDIMRMRMVPELVIKSKTATMLTPGGYHLMLFGLKKILIENQTASLTLNFRKKNGTTIKQTVQAKIRKLNELHPQHH